MKSLIAIALSLCLFGVAGCGKDLSKLTGTWKVTTTSTTTCGGINNTSTSNPGDTSIKVGTTSDLVVLDACSCDTQWTASSSSTASLNVGQTCASCGLTNITFSGGTITTDGTTITFTYMGSGTYLGAACTFTSTGSGNKISQ